MSRGKMMRIACRTSRHSERIRKALETAGFKCIVFCNDSDMASAVRDQSFDLVLADSESFDRRELVAEIDRIEVCGFTLDRTNNQVFDRGAPVKLRRIEFELAWRLFSSPGVYMSKKQIAGSLWGLDEFIANHRIEQHIYKLRKKLDLSPERSVVITAAYLNGYRLEIEKATGTGIKAHPEALAA